MGQTSTIREAVEGVQTTAGTSVATAHQSVAAHAPPLARTTAPLARASSAFGDTAESRYYDTKLAFITFFAAAHTQLLPECGMSVALAD